MLEVLGVPNARVQADQWAWEALAAGEARWPTCRPAGGGGSHRDRARSVVGGGGALGLRGAGDVVARARGRVCGCVVRAGGGGAAAARLAAGAAPGGSTTGAQANNPLAVRQQQQVVPVLRAYVQGQLPEYMVPAAFVVLEALPLTPNGKVDRRALPAPETGRPQLAGQYVAPRTPVEQHVAAIWELVLGVEGVGVHDNFFALGGHSLLATQVVSYPHHVCGGCRCARCSRRRRWRPWRSASRRPSADVPPIVPTVRGAEVPLSFAQQRLWFWISSGRLRPTTCRWYCAWRASGGRAAAAHLRDHRAAPRSLAHDVWQPGGACLSSDPCARRLGCRVRSWRTWPRRRSATPSRPG